MADKYFKGQGKLYISQRDATGQPVGGFRWLGNVPMVRISTSTEQTSHTESYTGDQLEDLVIYDKKRCSLMFTMEEFSKENLALALFGTGTDIAGATITAETHKAYLGRSLILNQANITTFTSLTDTGAATTYVEGTDYTVDLSSGLVDIPAGSSIPDDSDVEANYAAGTSTKVSTYTATNEPYWLFFQGLNTADSKKPVLIDLYKVNLQPQKEWDLIQNDNNLSKLDMEGNVLYDALQPDTTTDGRFMRVRFI